MVVTALFQKIVSLLLMLLSGVLLVKGGIVKSEDAGVFSRISLYLFSPCVILTSFQVKLTGEIRAGLLGCLAAVLCIHSIYVFCGFLYRRFFSATAVEQTSIIYPNCGNIIIPIVAAVLGTEYVIYTSVYISVYNVMVWTHGISIFQKTEEGAEHDAPVRSLRRRLQTILLNPNILAILMGFAMLAFGIRLPHPAADAISDIGAMIGPAGMIITGMILGGMSLRRVFGNTRIYGVIVLRMLILPLLALGFLKLSGMGARIPDGHKVLLVTFLGAIAPTGANVNQFAILYNRDAGYSSSINILTTLSAILTMPFLVWLYELL